MFCDLEQLKFSAISQSPCPILATLSASPHKVHTSQVVSSTPTLVPGFHPPPGPKVNSGGELSKAEYRGELWREWALHTYEWLALASLGPADRVKASDSIDPYLSTYSVEQEEGEEGGREMTRVTFRGIVPAVWIRELWVVFW